MWFDRVWFSVLRCGMVLCDGIKLAWWSVLQRSVVWNTVSLGAAWCIPMWYTGDVYLPLI